MEFCYLVRRNAITTPDIERLKETYQRFLQVRNVFIESGVRIDISLPRQHALSHYIDSISLFGSPNGLCSSITESKHIKAVKEPWRRSSRYRALQQMLNTLMRLDKLAALRRVFAKQGMMTGSTSTYMAKMVAGEELEENSPPDNDEEDEVRDDSGAEPGPKALSSVELAVSPGKWLDLVALGSILLMFTRTTIPQTT
jgi:hypothetical protein